MAATGRVPLAAYSFFLTPSVYGGDGAYGGARVGIWRRQGRHARGAARTGPGGDFLGPVFSLTSQQRVDVVS